MKQYGCFKSFPFRKNFVIFVCHITWYRWNVQHWTFGVNVHNKNSNRFVPFWCSILNLKKSWRFLLDRYQLNYFICIKNFNAETITSLKLNLFSFFICCCQHHQRKTSRHEKDGTWSELTCQIRNNRIVICFLLFFFQVDSCIYLDY